jgi:lipopolysaccharide transport system ATP-binding protein
VPWKIIDPHAAQGYGMPAFYTEPLEAGNIYGTVYLTHRSLQDFIHGRFWRWKKFFYPRSFITNWWNYGIRHNPYRSFVIVRDLRDTLVSLYFSTKKSHEIVVDRLTRIRHSLESVNDEDGFMYLMNDVLPDSAAIQESWIGVKDTLLLRYEDILDNEYTFFEQLIDYSHISVSRERLHDIIRYNLFEVATGRKRGVEDINAHLRKGIAGDWRNYFTDGLKNEFKKRFGDILITTGYEKDLNW